MQDLNTLSNAVGQELTAADVNLAEYLEENVDGTKTLRLEFPYTVQMSVDGAPRQDVEVTELVFGRPKAGYIDILAKATSDAQAMKAIRELIAKHTGAQEKHIAERMDSEDFWRALVLVMGFFPKPKSRQTGGN